MPTAWLVNSGNDIAVVQISVSGIPSQWLINHPQSMVISPGQVMGIPISSSPELTLETLSRRFQKRQSQIRKINEYSLYPDESLLWDENLVPEGRYENDAVLALPKLNLQFLTVRGVRHFLMFSSECPFYIISITHFKSLEQQRSNAHSYTAYT